jgi:hypothetical protein
VVLDDGTSVELGDVETTPTIGITDYSRRETDDYGVTTVVKRGFSRFMSVKLGVPFDSVDAVQRELAALRATPARWVADDRFASLDLRGYYKDFSLDLSAPPLSYCTLTVDALAETDAIADDGSDPATDGQASTLRLVQPFDVTDAVLVASNVPETDYPEWAVGVSYAKGARVIKAATHLVYESAADANAGADPAGATGAWFEVGATNRWAMFDQALGSATVRDGSVQVRLAPTGPVTALALLDVVGATVAVHVDGYDRTLPVTAGAIVFDDLPGSTSAVTVTVTGGGQVEVGTLLMGRMVGLGTTEASPTASITDYSVKTTDDFGEVTIVPRAWAKGMSAKALIRTTAIDVVANRIASVRAKPCLWIGGAGIDALTIYGFFKDFSIAVDDSTSKLSLTIEGLSQAAKITPLTASTAWPDVTDPDGTKPENGATVGAPDGTYVGSGPDKVLAQDVVSNLATLTEGAGEASDAIARIAAQTRAGAPNLLSNTDGRDGLNGWTLGGSGWSVVPQSQIGSYFVNVGGGVGAYMFQDVPIQQGVAYSYSYEGDPDAANDRLYVQWVNADKSQLVQPSAAGVTSDNWMRAAAAPVVPPVGAAYARVVYDRPATAGALRATRFQFQQGAATEWNDAADGYVVTTLVRTEITERKGDTAALVGRADTLDAQVSGNAPSGLQTQLQGQITQTAQAAADAKTAAVQTQTSLSASIRAGAANLLKNGDFKDGLNNWIQIGGGWGTAYDARVGWFAYHNAYGSSTALDYLFQDVPINAGQSYSISYEGNPTDGTHTQGVWFDWIKADGSLVSGNARGATLYLAQGDFGYRGSAQSGAPPADAVRARIYVVSQQNGSHYGTRVMFQAGAATVWRDDASLAEMRGTVTTQAYAIADIVNNKLRAGFSLVANVGGSGVAGIIGSARMDDGTTSSDLALIAGKFGFWMPRADGTLIQAMGLGTNALGQTALLVYGEVQARSIRTDQIVVGGVSWDNLDNSMGSQGAASWTGIATPSAGQTITIPLGLTVPNVKPRGRFFMTATAVVTSNAGTVTTNNYNGTGKPLRTTYVQDYVVDIVTVDPQGNAYSALGNAFQAVRATSGYDANFTAYVTAGNSDSGVIDRGDSYSRTVSATPTVTSMKANVAWTAT